MWSHEFYSNWKDWVVPSDGVSVDSGGAAEDGFRLYGRIGSLGEGLLGMPMRCLLKERQKVSLLKVGLFSRGDDSGFSYSYVAKIMWVLFGMRDGQRDELGLILRGSLRGGRICPAYGFWYNEIDKSVYLVCERYNWSSFNKFKPELGCVEEEIENDVYEFTMIGMEICEAVSGLHKEGLVNGCLALSCFDIDEFGHVYIDFNEVLMMGGRIHTMIAEAVLGTRNGKEFEMRLEDEILKTQMFVSPELLLEMLQNVGIDLGTGNLRSAVGYGSDVWSLACVLLWHLVGKPFIDHMNSYLCSLALLATDENGSDFKGLYMSWLEKVNIVLDSRLCSEVSSMKDFLCKCLDFDPGRRPSVEDVWKCIRGLIIKPRADVMVSSEKEIAREKKGHCILLGELCQLLKGTSRISEKLTMDDLKNEDENGRVGEKVEELMVKRDLIEGISSGHLKCIDLKGHLDCITGLAIGGFFSCPFI